MSAGSFAFGSPRGSMPGVGAAVSKDGDDLACGRLEARRKPPHQGEVDMIRNVETPR
jgi:hypothetical protein